MIWEPVKKVIYDFKRGGTQEAAEPHLLAGSNRTQSYKRHGKLPPKYTPTGDRAV